MPVQFAKEAFHDFVDLLFPTFCLACSDPVVRGEKLICTTCAVNLPYTNYHLKHDNALSMRFWGKLPIEYALAYLTFAPKGRVQQILHKFKYKGAKDLGSLLGNWYGATLLNAGLDNTFDLSVPVPLHKAKMRLRGYNQADVFGAGISETLGVEHNSEALQRNIFTQTQTNKARLQRWENVEQVFSVKKPELVVDKHVLLIDDVITTGSTLEACAKVLYAAGAHKVSIAALAAA
ncbi:MAG: ComF family protein [Sphingobacteriales bacterium]|nr:MAG: ComF family protein [Sphingobacteriales bacterium]